MAHAKTMLDKLKAAAPYNIFYSKIPDLSDSEDSSSVSFTDFLCPSLGKLKCSLHIISRIDIDVDIEWLIEQYRTMNVETTPLTILYAKVEGKSAGKSIEKSRFPNVNLKCLLDDETVKMNYNHSNHHERISIFVYEDNSLRIVISTSNIRKELQHFNDGFWMSPLCRPLDDDSSGESPTNFKSDLLDFFNYYELPILEEWLNYIRKADFSDVKVFLITSVSGRYSPDEPGSHVQQVQNILKKHCHLSNEEESSWPLVAQAPNMGEFGESVDVWLRSFFLNRLASPSAQLKIVFPTWKQVKNGRFDADVVGGGLRYSRYVHNNQTWLQEYLYQWKAVALGRSKIMPHTKTYCRVSPCSTKMAWFLLTTANINKGAWGDYYHTKEGVNTDDIFVRNYETGVMFLPKFFDEEYFHVKNDLGAKVFPLIYDLPLTKYTEKDYPWCFVKPKNRAN